MKKEESKDEINYQITMESVKNLYLKGLMSKDEYKDFEEKMKEKYKPEIGGLFSNINLI